MLITIVIPCYNSEKSIRTVVELTIKEFEKHDSYFCEFVLVNDGSGDNTFEEIRKLCADYSNVRGIDLMRNFGQHNALMVSLNYAKGDYIIGMDDDLQTQPSEIFKLVKEIEKGYDLVYGVYAKKKNSSLKNVTSKINEVTSRLLLGRPGNIISSNFWIITSKVAAEVAKCTNYNPYIDGIFYRTTHNIGNVLVEHGARKYGTSNYTLKKLFNLWLAYWNYSLIPLRISSVLGSVSAITGFVGTIICLVLEILKNTTDRCLLIFIVLLMSGLILLCIAIAGEYLGKVLLTVNQTPQYIIRERLNVTDEEKK